MTATGLQNRANAALDRSYRRGGFWGDLLLGAALGPTFSSCSPTYALIIATVLPVSFGVGVLYIVAYALGLALMLLLVAFLGQAFARKLGWLANPTGWFRRVIGILLIVVGPRRHLRTRQGSSRPSCSSRAGTTRSSSSRKGSRDDMTQHRSP